VDDRDPLGDADLGTDVTLTLDCGSGSESDDYEY
jgi:hypothetical protein